MPIIRFRLVRPLALAMSLFAGLAQGQPGSVSFWYADNPPLEELAQFDWTVLEPGHVEAGDIAYLKAQGSVPFAYLSVGEFDGQLGDQPLARGASEVRNDAWNSQVMRLDSPQWREHLLARAASLREQGYQGLFLDTLDSFQLQAEAQQEPQRLALLSLLRELHRREPQLKLFFNRGFEVLPELPGVAAAVAVESIHAGWDAAAGRYRQVPQGDRDWLRPRLEAIRASGTPIVAIDYLPAGKRREARELAARLQAEGFVPYVTTPDLDSLGVGPVEVQPRRIAMLYDPREGDLETNTGHMYLGGLLEWMGYRVDYWAVDRELPAHPLQGLYAGVVTWMTSGPPENAEAFDQWLEARLDERLPLVFLGGLPTANDSLLQRLGLRLQAGKARLPLRLEEQDAALVGHFEAPLRLRARDLPELDVADPELARPALSLRSEGRRYVPLATGEWGGVALAPYVIEEAPDHKRWIIDPFAFIQRALRLSPLPSPDATTENGRRIATVHIDGDGFVSRAEVPGSPYAGSRCSRPSSVPIRC